MIERQKKSFRVLIIFFVLLTIAVLGILGTIYFYAKARTLASDKENVVTQEKVKELVVRLGKLIELPKDETPTIATISDVAKLRGQTFFSAARNGDLLFAYPVWMKAILYRPSINKIINVAPITNNPSASEPAKVIKANGKTLTATAAPKR